MKSPSSNKVLYEKDGTPRFLYVTLTFGVASILCQGIHEKLKDAKQKSCEIRKSGGAPRIYECRLIK